MNRRPLLALMIVLMMLCAERRGHGRGKEDELAEADRLSQPLIELYKTGRYTDATLLAQRALKIREAILGDNHPDIAASLYILAVLYKAQGEYAKAEPLYHRALKIRESTLGGNHPDVAGSLDKLAELYRKQGEYAKAEPLYHRALKIKEAALGGNHPDVATSLNNLAGLYSDQGAYAKAEPLYHRALKIKEAALGGNHPDVAQSLNDLAVLYNAQEEYAKAEPLFHRALKIWEVALGGNHLYVAQILNNLAVLYTHQGAYAKAEPLFHRALKIWEAAMGGNHPGVTQSLNNLAALYNYQGEYAKAEPLFLRALKISEAALGGNHPDVAQSLNNLAVLYNNQGEYAKAEPLFLRALKIWEAALGGNHPDVAQSLNNLAVLYSEQGEYAKAEPLYHRALKIREAVLGGNHPHVAASLNDLAWLYKNQERLFLPLLHRAMRIKERWIEHHALSASRRDLMWKKESGDELRIYALAHQSSGEPAIQQLALSMVLLRKARSADETSRSAQVQHQRLSTPMQRAQLERLRMMRTQLASLYLRPATSADYRQTLVRLDHAADDLESTLASEAASFRSQQLPDLDQIVPQVARTLPSNAVLIELVVFLPRHFKAKGAEPRWGDPRYLAFLLFSDRQIRVIDLGRALPIDTAIQQFHQQLSRPTTDPTPAAQALYKLVMAPLLPHLQGRTNLFVSPDDQLNLLPFAALHDGKDYLLGRYHFTYLPSGRMLLRNAEQQNAPLTMTVLADPDFASHPSSLPQEALVQRDASRDLRLGAASLPPLPGTRTEALALQKIFPKARLLLGKDASESALLATKAPGILHLATHGLFLTDTELTRWKNDRGLVRIEDPRTLPLPPNPLARSALALAGAASKVTDASENADGLATALEILNMDLWGTQLVVLSACDTGRGDIKVGQGVYGLSRAFLVAGAQTIVSSLWKVSDQQTQQLMQSYYTRLLRGEGRMAALEQAAIEMRARQAHPYYWAPFIALGNGAPLRGVPRN